MSHFRFIGITTINSSQIDRITLIACQSFPEWESFCPASKEIISELVRETVVETLKETDGVVTIDTKPLMNKLLEDIGMSETWGLRDFVGAILDFPKMVRLQMRARNEGLDFEGLDDELEAIFSEEAA